MRDSRYLVSGGEADVVQNPAVALADGGFEVHEGDTFTEWYFQDDPGSISFADTSTYYEGSSSIRFAGQVPPVWRPRSSAASGLALTWIRSTLNWHGGAFPPREPHRCSEAVRTVAASLHCRFLPPATRPTAPAIPSPPSHAPQTQPRPRQSA